MEALTSRAPRLGVINLDLYDKLAGQLPSDEPEPTHTIWAQFNPTELELSVKAVYQQHIVPGMSHTVKQFSHTENMTFGLDLFFRVHDPLEPWGNMPRFSVEERAEVEAFFLSLVVPRGETVIAQNSPPPVMVVWPKFLTFECAVNEVKLKYSQFNRFGDPIEMTASLQLEEVRSVRYSSKQAYEWGLRRARNPREFG
jgi:Contractile injection system tube protein